MLAKKERLSRTEFNRFFAIGKRIHSPHLTLVYTLHTNLHASVVVPKKVEKGAVGRNKIRRRIYDIVRRVKKDTDVSGVYIFLAKQSIGALPYANLKDEVEAVIIKAQK